MAEHNLRYRRPETPWSLTQITARTEDVPLQVERLIALGYAVEEVTPPLTFAADGVKEN